MIIENWSNYEAKIENDSTSKFLYFWRGITLDLNTFKYFLGFLSLFLFL